MKIQIAIFVVCLALLGGCGRPVPKVWTDLPTAESLLERLHFAAESRQSVDTEAHVSVNLEGKYVSTEQFLLAQKPARLRADVLTGFGQLIMQVAIDNDYLSAYLNTTVPGKYYQGPATQENLSRFVRIPLEIKDLVSFLLYAPPLIDYNRANVAAQDDMLVLRLFHDAYRQEIVFDPALRMIESRYYWDKDLQLQVNYANFNTQHNFPKLLKIEVPGRLMHLTVAMVQPSINAEIADDQFRISAPQGALIETL